MVVINSVLSPITPNALGKDLRLLAAAMRLTPQKPVSCLTTLLKKFINWTRFTNVEIGSIMRGWRHEEEFAKKIKKEWLEMEEQNLQRAHHAHQVLTFLVSESSESDGIRVETWKITSTVEAFCGSLEVGDEGAVIKYKQLQVRAPEHLGGELRGFRVGVVVVLTDQAVQHGRAPAEGEVSQVVHQCIMYLDIFGSCDDFTNFRHGLQQRDLLVDIGKADERTKNGPPVTPTGASQGGCDAIGRGPGHSPMIALQREAQATSRQGDELGGSTIAPKREAQATNRRLRQGHIVHFKDFRSLISPITHEPRLLLCHQVARLDGRCSNKINADTEDPKAIINVKQLAEFVVDLSDQRGLLTLVLSLPKVCCSVVHWVQARHSLLGQLLIELTVASFELLDLNLYRNTLVRGHKWFKRSLKWPGEKNPALPSLMKLTLEGLILMAVLEVTMKIALAIWGLLWFHTYLMISHSISLKNDIEILMGIALK
ncbi:hypothetical protein QTO34_001851, partial [Cnephaeus nilssonii]